MTKKKTKDEPEGPTDALADDDMDADEVPVIRAVTFSKHYGTRVLSMTTEYDFRIMLANEKMMDEDGTEFYIGESMWILTPTAAKELLEDLKGLVKEWEKEMGRIGPRPRETKYSEQVL
jgi:hypothetical protein